MRRRSTFVHSPTYDFDPAEIVLKPRQLLHPGIKAAREERLTFGFDELPAQLIDLLQQSSQIYIRWSPEKFPGSIPPFSSRTTPGLHLHYTPLQKQANSLICPLLREIFSRDLKCESPEASFSQPDTLPGHSESTGALQYYSLLPSLNQFVAYIQRNICSRSNQQCIHDAALLNIVDHLSLDYNNKSRTLILTAFWSKAPPAIYDPIGQLTTLDQWPLDIPSSKNKKDKVEVGILSSIPGTDPHELQLSGVLTVVGEDDTPKATQFSFPSRHHVLTNTQASKQAYTVSFQKPTGLHPILKISFPSAAHLTRPTTIPDESECSLNAYLTLPSSIFPDEYAFSAKDPLFERSHNLRSLRSISGELDLEAPDYVVQKWGSSMLLELAVPSSNPSSSTPTPRNPSWNVTIPLHLRYQPPSPDGLNEIHVPWPVLFWACTADSETNFAGNPFDRVHLGYDALFGDDTAFYHLRPAPRPENEGRLVEKINVPVLDTARVGGDVVIERATLVVMLLGFAWVVMKLWPGISDLLRGGGSLTVARDETKVKEKRQ